MGVDLWVRYLCFRTTVACTSFSRHLQGYMYLTYKKTQPPRTLAYSQAKSRAVISSIQSSRIPQIVLLCSGDTTSRRMAGVALHGVVSPECCDLACVPQPPLLIPPSTGVPRP
jgi:hypothetical protein